MNYTVIHVYDCKNGSVATSGRNMVGFFDLLQIHITYIYLVPFLAVHLSGGLWVSVPGAQVSH